MNHIEQTGIKCILDKLRLEDLFSLTFTVTKGLIKPETREESVTAALLYCETPTLLLRRRKVKKEFLFNYLKSEGIIVSVSGDKSDYIKACLKHWGSKVSQNAVYDDHMDEEMEDLQVHPIDPHPYQNNYQTWETRASPELSELLTMGQNFSYWFYQLVNEVCTKGPNSGGDALKSDHFWPDCHLKWEYHEGNSIQSGVVQTSHNVAEFFSLIVASNALQFNPSIPSVSSKYDSFGLVQIGVEGVVHQVGNSVGLFRQVFGLIKDPQETLTDKWRIKYSEIQLKINCLLLLNASK